MHHFRLDIIKAYLCVCVKVSLSMCGWEHFFFFFFTQFGTREMLPLIIGSFPSGVIFKNAYLSVTVDGIWGATRHKAGEPFACTNRHVQKGMYICAHVQTRVHFLALHFCSHVNIFIRQAHKYMRARSRQRSRDVSLRTQPNWSSAIRVGEAG